MYARVKKKKKKKQWVRDMKRFGIFQLKDIVAHARASTKTFWLLRGEKNTYKCPYIPVDLHQIAFESADWKFCDKGGRVDDGTAFVVSKQQCV